MRIIILSGIYPPDIGGPATHASMLSAELRRRGHLTSVVTLSDEEEVLHSDLMHRWPRGWSWPRRTWAIVRWMVVNRGSYDVIYATGLHGVAVIAAKLARRRVVVKVVGDPAWERSRRLGLTDEGIDGFATSRARNPRVALMRAVRDWTVKSADEVIVPSVYLRDLVGRWVGGLEPRVVPNGVSVPDHLRGAPSVDSVPDGHVQITFVGRFVSHKRIDVLIDSVSKVPELSLELIGDGPELSALRERARLRGVEDRLIFRGELDHQETLSRLARADALVLASEYEGLPHVAIEALALGTPLIAASAGGVTEVLRDQENGILVRGPGVDPFVLALEAFCRDPELRRRLSDGALADSARWSFDRTADQIEELLGAVSDGRPRTIFLGKTVIRTGSPDIRRKLEIIGRHLDAVLVNIGEEGSERLCGVRVVRLPSLKPSLLGGLFYYTVAPVVGLHLAGRSAAALVCQSPFEAFVALLLKNFYPGRKRSKIVVEVHGDWRTAARMYGSSRRRYVGPLSDRIAEWAVRKADRVRVVSSFTRDLVREVGYRGEVDEHIAFNDLSAFMKPEILPLPDQPTATFIGVLERYKGIDVLLDAWEIVIREVPDARLLVVGQGTLSDRMASKSRKLGLGSHIEFVGRVPRPEIVGVLDRSSLLVLPSRSEGLGLVLLEAMARARPIVGSNVGGIRELVSPDRTGLLVPPDDPSALASALISLLSDRQRSDRMGRAARASLQERDLQAEFEAGVIRLARWVGEQ